MTIRGGAASPSSIRSKYNGFIDEQQSGRGHAALRRSNEVAQMMRIGIPFPLRPEDEEKWYSSLDANGDRHYGFAIEANAPGVRILCREPFSGRNRYDHPASARFDEQDAMVVFDDMEADRKACRVRVDHE
jgi:hypothetical protein